MAKVLIKYWKWLVDSPGPPKGEKGKEREEAKKKENGLDSLNWKPRQAFLFQGKSKGKGPEAIDGRIKWHIRSGYPPPKHPAAP